ncbi:rhythmically expressed gene 2 protein-like [Zerene cesonia]|uniref:rhythmically expressed gene 2 protein-like n=1 Tax=Zerene cesonia TaxID=33412 RepID=UPI0018E54033|nr:rhythmically expressed gene 2 protein-like [Zerene cesonia]XP_038216851.1 rhythmically expressed gene 2 protein-like [Zerene cesonia]
MFPNKIKLITFDATNTLLKFCTTPWEYYSKVASENGYKVSEDVIKDQFYKSYRVFSQEYPNFGRETIHWDNWWRRIVHATFNDQIRDTAAINRIATALIEDYKTPKCWCHAKGSLELLRYLKKHGVTLGVISNFDPRLHEILHKMCVHSYFKFVLTSYEAGYSKPDRRIFESAVKLSSAPVLPHECLHIGDDFKKDFEGAKGAGWHGILVRDNKSSLEQLNPKYQCLNLIELKGRFHSEKMFL